MSGLAKKFRDVKFIKAISTTCIPNYPDKNLPTIFVYLEGDIKAQFIGPLVFGGMNLTRDGECLHLWSSKGKAKLFCWEWEKWSLGGEGRHWKSHEIFFFAPMAQPCGYLVQAVIGQHTDICLVRASFYALYWVEQILLDILKSKQYPCFFFGCLGHEWLPLPAVIICALAYWTVGLLVSFLRRWHMFVVPDWVSLIQSSQEAVHWNFCTFFYVSLPSPLGQVPSTGD